jgi:hypothetical protein
MIAERDAEITRLKAEVERLRTGHQGACYACELVGELNIRLKAELERLRAALKMHACDCTFAAQCAVPTKCRNYLARAALTAQEKTDV